MANKNQLPRRRAPWIAEEKRDGVWRTIHKDLLKQTADHKKDLKVIFFGDSLTDFWSDQGKDVWQKYYADRHAFNYGIAGDRTEHLLWRVEHGEFEGLDAKLVVLLIGTNNMWMNSNEDIARGIKEVVNQIRVHQPNAKVLLLGILPRTEPGEKRVQAINEMIAKYNNDETVFYLDMSSHFQNSPGVQIEGLFADRLHLTTKGYEVWQQAMEPMFSKLYDS